MAALLQTVLQPPPSATKPSSWTHNSKLGPSLPHILPCRRRRAPWHLQATGGATDFAVTPKKSRKHPSKKKKNRKEKLAQEQQQLLETVAKNGGGDGEDEDELPQVVFDRIIRRIVFMVGIPMVSGVGLLNVYDALKRGQGVVVPSWLPLLTILLSFGTSALGIAYGTLSASWDPEKEGSLLGLEEARKNWPELWKDEVDKK